MNVQNNFYTPKPSPNTTQLFNNVNSQQATAPKHSSFLVTNDIFAVPKVLRKHQNIDILHQKRENTFVGGSVGYFLAESQRKTVSTTRNRNTRDRIFNGSLNLSINSPIDIPLSKPRP